jgi:hypothetical protein
MGVGLGIHTSVVQGYLVACLFRALRGAVHAMEQLDAAVTHWLHTCYRPHPDPAASVGDGAPPEDVLYDACEVSVQQLQAIASALLEVHRRVAAVFGPAPASSPRQSSELEGMSVMTTTNRMGGSDDGAGPVLEQVQV